MKKKLAAVSIDLDSIVSYYQIHGLGEPPVDLRHIIIEDVLPRYQTLLAETSIRATFFTVAKDLSASEKGQHILRELQADGHEIANHSYSHPYDLFRQPGQKLKEEIEKAHECIHQITGTEPIGFRSPGYGLSPALIQVLEQLNYHYDSSVFPSVPYYLAKGAIMGLMAFRGHQSQAVMGDPRFLAAPLSPYHPNLEKPWRRGKAKLLEIPISVMPITGLPLIGTLLMTAPSLFISQLHRLLGPRPLFNFELHGIDLADAMKDRIPTELAGRQPDLRVPYLEKRRRLADFLNQLSKNFQVKPLKEAISSLKC